MSEMFLLLTDVTPINLIKKKKKERESKNRVLETTFGFPNFFKDRDSFVQLIAFVEIQKVKQKSVIVLLEVGPGAC